MNANRTAFLKWLDGLEPQIYELNSSCETAIGRDSNCEIVLNSARYGSVSRRHAVIRYQPESLAFEISDLGSSNGTYVNRQRLSGGQLLKSGDRIQLGSHGVEFSFEDPSLPATVVQSDPNADPDHAPVTLPDIAIDRHSGNEALHNSSPPSPPSPLPSPSPPSPLPSPSSPPFHRSKTLIRTALLVGSGLFVALLLWQRRIQPIGEQAPSVPAESPQTDLSTSSNDQSARSSATIPTQTYTDPNGKFQIDLPSNYAIATRANGINLASPDGSFQGAITVIEIPRQITAAEMVQEFTRQQSANANLQSFTIQNNTTVAGGVRIDWIARLENADAEDAEIDAVTHLIQRDNLVIEVDLFAIDRSFTQQDATEANLILGSLHIGN
jgi:pSer/pThr/pTyr-binding forkhead associated (FHA) protein